MPPGKSQCALGQGQAPRGNMSSCPRTALLLTSCARAMAAGTPSCSASVLGGMMCHGRRPLKLFPVHAGPPSRLVFFPVPRRTHPGPARLRVWSSVPACVPLLREFGPFEPVEQQQSKEESSVGVAGGEGHSLVTAAQRDHPRGCGPLHSPVPPDGGGARGEPSRAPAGLRSGPRAQAAALHS